MPHAKVSIQEFREDFPGDSSDESLARDVVQYLDHVEGARIVQAAKAYLEASRVFEEVCVAAGIRRE
jgi:hypothetical protein